MRNSPFQGLGYGERSGIMIGMPTFIRMGHNQLRTDLPDNFRNSLHEFRHMQPGFLIHEAEIQALLRPDAGEANRGEELLPAPSSIVFAIGEISCSPVSYVDDRDPLAALVTGHPYGRAYRFVVRMRGDDERALLLRFHNSESCWHKMGGRCNGYIARLRTHMTIGYRRTTLPGVSRGYTRVALE